MSTQKISLVITLYILSLCLFSCSQEELQTENQTIEQEYFSQQDLSQIKDWLQSQDVDNFSFEEFPTLDFIIPSESSTEKELVNFYQNGIMYLTDDIKSGEDLNYNIIKDQIQQDDRLDESAKTFLFSFIQLSSEILLSETIPLTNARSQDACDCSGAYDVYLNYYIQCQAYGNYWGHCTAASNAYSFYQSCLNKQTTCPPGFVFDGANCYSGIIIPSGYDPFIWGNGFYTKQNCSISTANNCCPSGYGYDGANCHYWGVYFPSQYEPFIWGNSFYVVPECL